MRQSLGETGSSIGERHALICPDSHERTTLPGWLGSSIIVLISPQMGAKFIEYFVDVAPGASSQAPAEGIERFFFVLEGEAKLTLDGKKHDLTVEGYAYLPANSAHVEPSSTMHANCP